MLIGTIASYDGHTLTIKASFPDAQHLQRHGCRKVEIRLIDGRSITIDQRKKAYALLGDISDYTGYTPDEAKQEMKRSFITNTGCSWFSLSNVDKTTARAFIDHMVALCLEHGIPCQDSLLNKAEDIGRYLYLCLYHRKCCVCGKEAEVHHVDTIGMGGDRQEICHVGYRTMALCRIHHTQCHGIGQAAFNQRFHVYGVKLDAVLAKRLKLGKPKDNSQEGE